MIWIEFLDLHFVAWPMLESNLALPHALLTANLSE
jgi:hypothetical protein